MAADGVIFLSALALQPVAVAPEVQRAQLSLGLADQVTFIDQHLVGIPPERLALGAVAPAYNRAPASGGIQPKIFEAQDILHGWATFPLALNGHEASS